MRNSAHSIDSAEFGPAAAARALMARILGSPRDAIAILVALAAAGAILVNALLLQPGPHPAPMFAVKRPVAEPAVPASRCRARGRRKRRRPGLSRTSPSWPRPSRRRGRAQRSSPISSASSPGAASMTAQSMASSDRRPIRRSAISRRAPRSSLPANRARRCCACCARRPDRCRCRRRGRAATPIAELLAPSQRVLAVQRALAISATARSSATGVYGPETVAAIEKFERERKLPVTGQITPRLMRELAALTGRPLE